MTSSFGTQHIDVDLATVVYFGHFDVCDYDEEEKK